MTATEIRKKVVDLMTSRVGLNSYTQGGNRIYFFGKPDNMPGNRTQKGYSDCSSAVRAVIKAVTGIDIGGNTSAQINNRTKKGVIVHETSGYYPDESKLLPGDCLYFKGNTSHPLDVGHVEMYIGNGKLCGHGSGTGPKIKNMQDYCKSRANAKRRYFMTIRWIQGGEEVPTDPYVRRDNLKKGMYGNDVAALQHALVTLGYSVGKWGVDGDFGEATEAAVIAFQTANGLLNTGIVNDETWRRIDLLMDGNGDPDEDESEAVPEPIMNGVAIANGKWNVRTGPGTEYPSAGIVRGGDVLEKVDLNGWTPVKFNGEVVFVGPSAVKEG